MSRSEIVIVGAGVIGAATAYELARRGAQVTLVEREYPAYGASGRNVGFLWTHTRKAGVEIEMALASRKRYDQLAEEIDDFELRASGGMIYFFEHQQALFPAFVENRRAAGLPMELLDAAAARERCPILPDDIGGATWNPVDGHVNPPRTTECLVAAAERHGARLLQGTAVTGLEVAGGRCTGVRTDAGGIAADTVIVTAGSWAPTLLDPVGVRVPIEPMRLQVIETEPIEQRFDPILYGPTGVKQYALTKDLDGYEEELFTHPLELALPGTELLECAGQRRDGSVLFGLSMDFVGLDQRTTVGGLGLSLAVLADHLPVLRDVPIRQMRAGLLPQTPDALPVLDRAPGVEGLVIAAGHVFGQMAGPISGVLVAQMLMGEPTDLDMAPFRYDRPAITEAIEAGAELRRW
jgi:glycine/D-amino acid oxidase-like deaminating enzyme